MPEEEVQVGRGVEVDGLEGSMEGLQGVVMTKFRRIGQLSDSVIENVQ